jgi:hypothetical protein
MFMQNARDFVDIIFLLIPILAVAWRIAKTKERIGLD